MANKPPNKKTGPSPSGSGAPAASENAASASATPIPQPGAATRVIGNITRTGTESTARGGGPKLKFTPNMPARRKKPEGEVKVEPSTPRPLAPLGDRGRGRGNLGRGVPRGSGRSGGPPRDEAPMIASGPFAMGPAAAASSGHRGPFISSSFGRLAASEKFGLDLTGGSALALPRNRDALAMEEDVEVYSDGEEVVDLGDVRVLDVMAPDALKKERRKEKKKKVRVEETKTDVKGKGKAAESMDVDIESANLAQALDLSESEEENELENLQDDFITGSGFDDLDDDRPRMYLFQFPAPFPTFIQPAPAEKPKPGSPRGKRVTFAEDVKEGGEEKPSGDHVKKEKEDPGPLEGIIGHLEILASGAVRMRLGNDMVFDVSAATQPSFLQQAIALDKQKGTLDVLGSVQRRFVVSPDLDALLADVEAVELQAKTRAEAEAEAATMDVL